MALRLERADLVAALTATARVVESRNTYPILANVLLSVADGRLTVRSTDLDIEITTSVPAEGDLPTTTAPAKTLLDIAKKFPAGAEVTLDLEGETLTVKAGRSRFKLGTLDVSGFPTLSGGDFGEPFETDLASLFAPVAFAISNEETRFYLNGIYLHTVAGRLRAVATDGHRLARHDGSEAPEFTGVIVPKKTVAIVPPGTVQVQLSATKIRLVAGDVVIVSKLIEGTFPDYDRVTPKNNDKVLVVDRAQFAAALDRVSIVANDRGSKAVKVAVAEDRLELTCTNSEGGSATEDVSVDSEVNFAIGYNAGYLAEIIRVAGGERVTFKWSEDNSPSLITGENDNWLSVLMPMRVS